jgi:bacteriocin-like protein
MKPENEVPKKDAKELDENELNKVAGGGNGFTIGGATGPESTGTTSSNGNGNSDFGHAQGNVN